MTALFLIILKLWLATAAVVLIWCAWRLWEVRFIAIPGAIVLMLCAGMQVMS